MSVCVVALERILTKGHEKEVRHVPEWIADDEETHVLVVCVVQDIIALGFHHFAVG